MTPAEARAELAAALEAADVPVRLAGAAPPCALIFGEGMDNLEHVIRGQVVGRFRATLIAGAWDVAATADVLDGLKVATIAAIRGAPGWRLDEVRRDTTVRIAGGDQLAADVIASRMVDVA